MLLGKIGTRICPMNAIVPYLSMQGTQPGPLFITKDGKYLT